MVEFVLKGPNELLGREYNLAFLFTEHKSGEYFLRFFHYGYKFVADGERNCNLDDDIV